MIKTFMKQYHLEKLLLNKKIKKEQLKEYISNGWIKGRKMKLN